MKRLYLVIALLFVPAAFAQTAAENIAAGRAALAAHNLPLATSKFEAALSQEPANQTAAALKMSTEEAAHLVQPGGPLYGLNTAQQGRFVVFGGGLPLLDGKEVIGGIGVSGGAVHEDVQVANAALAAWKNVRA